MLEYIDKNGVQRRVSSAADLAKAIQGGQIKTDTLVRIKESDPWEQAADNSSCIAVSVAGSPMASSEELQRAKHLRRLGWLGWAVGIPIILIGGTLAGFEAGMLGYMSGNAILGALLVALASAIWSRRNRSNTAIEQGMASARSGAAFAAVCGAILAYHVYNVTVEQREIRAIANTMEELVKATEANIETPSSTQLRELPVESVQPTDGDARKIRYVVETVAAQTLKIQQEYQAALSSADIATLLTPRLLLSDVGREDGRQRLKLLASAIVAMESHTEAMWDGIPDILREAGVSSSGQQEFLNGMAKSQPKNRERFGAFIKTQREFVSLSGQLIEFFESRRAPPQFVDEQYLFESDEDLEEFQRLVDGLTAQAELEVAAQNAMLDAQKQGIARMRERIAPSR